MIRAIGSFHHVRRGRSPQHKGPLAASSLAGMLTGAVVDLHVVSCGGVLVWSLGPSYKRGFLASGTGFDPLPLRHCRPFAGSGTTLLNQRTNTDGPVLRHLRSN